jgi:hypothetical protein
MQGPSGELPYIFSIPTCQQGRSSVSLLFKINPSLRIFCSVLSSPCQHSDASTIKLRIEESSKKNIYLQIYDTTRQGLHLLFDYAEGLSNLMEAS